MKEVLVLFSGGKDSLLSAVKYLDAGYKVNLVTYDNSCGIELPNAKTTSNRLFKKYGEDRVVFLGYKDVSAIFRNFIMPFYNFSFDYIVNNFGKASISQFNCLACRMSMYVASIIICKQKNINTIVDGARICQLFVIEQEKMLNKFKKFFKAYGLNIEYPVKNVGSDWDMKNELLIRGIVPKTTEPQCLLGCPLTKDNLSEKLIDSICNIFDKYLKEKAKKVVKDYNDINICEKFF